MVGTTSNDREDKSGLSQSYSFTVMPNVFILR